LPMLLFTRFFERFPFNPNFPLLEPRYICEGMLWEKWMFLSSPGVEIYPGAI